jgi:hypothetical protein
VHHSENAKTALTTIVGSERGATTFENEIGEVVGGVETSSPQREETRYVPERKLNFARHGSDSDILDIGQKEHI